MEKVGKSDLLVLSFDLSLNDITQTDEMVVMIRFWDTSESIVKTRYLGSSFFGHGRNDDILTHFNDITSKINKNHLYQISMDGPAVNHKFFNRVVSQRKTSFPG